MPHSTQASSSLPHASRIAPRRAAWVRATRWLRRMTFLVHRWLGIALALLMAVWAVSGIVMMYVAFPETTAEERAAGMEPLDLSECCRPAALLADRLDGAAVYMVAGEPVLRLAGPDGARLIPLSAETLPEIDAAAAGAIAAGHMRRALGEAPLERVEHVESDQWTVAGSFRRHAPLYKAVFADDAGTELYVSGVTGQVVQDTTRHERFWNWLGAVPHWLYFKALRERPELWSDVVIYASLLGTFLTVTGIYVGIRMYGRGKRKSPFRGVALWHHWTGLIFGLFTLTWVFSGLASMQPWGWLVSEGPGRELSALAGRPMDGADAEMLVQALAANPQPGVVSAELSVQRGEPYAILARADGSRFRASLPDLAPAPLSDSELAELAPAARPGAPVKSAGLIAEPDAYHYGHHRAVILPAWRIIYGDAGETRLYLDPATGELIGFADAPARAFRWWHSGLHSLDVGALRNRPLWDIVVLPLMIGVSLLCLIGVWMGIRRLRWRSSASARGARRKARRRQPQPAPPA